MSNFFDAIAWAIKVSRGEPMAARMLLIVGLAQRVGDREEGHVVWPSLKQICADTDMSRTSVKRWMRHLEERGLVEVFQTTRENGASGSNRYRLPVKAVFYHPVRGAMTEDDGEGSKSDRGGRSKSDRGGDRSYEPGRGPPAGPCIEQPSEQPNEGESTDELPLGLEPIPPKDPTPAEVGEFIANHWSLATELYEITPIRGGKLTEANAEKARALGKEQAIEGASPLDTWREIFTRIGESDFLQGKVPGREGRPPFKLTLGFLLEKRNFAKALEGRFGGQSTGERRRGSTSEATSRVVQRIRSGGQQRAGRGNPALTDARYSGGAASGGPRG